MEIAKQELQVLLLVISCHIYYLCVIDSRVLEYCDPGKLNENELFEPVSSKQCQVCNKLFPMVKTKGVFCVNKA